MRPCRTKETRGVVSSIRSRLDVDSNGRMGKETHPNGSCTAKPLFEGTKAGREEGERRKGRKEIREVGQLPPRKRKEREESEREGRERRRTTRGAFFS